MKINIPGWKPAVVILAFAALYTIALPFRPLFAPDEYDFAVSMLNYFPGMTGIVLPKLPAVVATLLTGGLIWLTAWKMHMQFPWIALCSYLLFIPVWYFGTSASAIPVFVFAVTLTVVLLFYGYKSSNTFVKAGCVFLAIPAAVATAWLGKSVFFTWQCISMAFTPVLAVSFCAGLEKLYDRGRGEKAILRLNRFFICCMLLILALILLPAICRIFKWNYPAELTIYPAGTSLVRPALTVIAPLLWFILSASLEKMPQKFIASAAGIGMMLALLPATLPWQKLQHNIPGKAVEFLAPELKKGNPVFFADSDSASVLEYQLRVKVQKIGRSSDAVPPAELKEKINKELETGDVIVAVSSKEFDSDLLRDRAGVVYTAGSRRFIRYSGGKK